MKPPENSKSIDDVRSHLQAIYTEAEIDHFVRLIEKIRILKKQKNAVILGHNYMTPEVYHGVSDYVGDSLGLSKIAGTLDAGIILFNGVHFMAETAKIMSPDKKVLIADLSAGCSLAESITAHDVLEMKKAHPGVPVVTYVNCSAEVKAETDICCTSANATKVVNSIPGDEVIFLPDKYLAQNVQKETKKKIYYWEGKCMVHELYTPEDIQSTRRQFQELTVVTHPECPPDVVALADFSGSTSQMADFIAQSRRNYILLLTECSMGDNIRHMFPEKTFISTCQTCPHMKKITLEKVLASLEEEKFEIKLDAEIIRRARRSVQAMFDIGV